MDRRSKSVENLIHAWILEKENKAAGKKEELSFASEVSEVVQPFLPLTPLRSVALYWDSQFVSAS